MVRISPHAYVEGMFESFPSPTAAQPGAWESMFHPRLLPKRARPFSVVTGFNTR